jgi:hypothetical protein
MHVMTVIGMPSSRENQYTAGQGSHDDNSNTW